jgi:hypothetical protein
MECLHKYSDGSKLIRTTIQQVLAIPIWKGNRIIDTAHVQRIRESIDVDGTHIGSLDSGYRIIVYNEEDAVGNKIEQRYIVDGQHRIAVIKELIGFCEDFEVTCIEKCVANEADAIEYFNKINNVKPIQYEEDPVILTNRYIQAIVLSFPGKKNLIRSGKTKRPYLYIDDLRKALQINLARLRKVPAGEFVKRMHIWNNRNCTELEIKLLHSDIVKDRAILESALQMKFTLAVDLTYKWIHDIL